MRTQVAPHQRETGFDLILVDSEPVARVLLRADPIPLLEARDRPPGDHLERGMVRVEGAENRPRGLLGEPVAVKRWCGRIHGDSRQSSVVSRRSHPRAASIRPDDCWLTTGD